MGFSNIPEAVYFYTDQKHTNENVTLSNSILDYEPVGENKISVFYRCINKREAYDEMTSKGISFIKRSNNSPRVLNQNIS